VVVGDYEGMKVLSVFKQAAVVPELFSALILFLVLLYLSNLSVNKPLK
jgi:hypothetical protein